MPPIPIKVLIETVIFDISGISGEPGFPGKGRAKHSETHSLYKYLRILIYKFYYLIYQFNYLLIYLF
jgi:hypothetical protein